LLSSAAARAASAKPPVELPRASAVNLDVSDEAAVKAAFARIPKLDIPIDNAGIGLVGSVEETELADFQRLSRINVEGLFPMTKYAMPLLLSSSAGSIVDVGSVAGMVGIKRRFGRFSRRPFAVESPSQESR
jgi:2-keto-3-deoxy-L-fuconate dehydrogenase